MATHKVEEVATRAEMDAVAECIWAAFETDPAHKIFFQSRGDPAASLADCKERIWKSHIEKPSTSHWIFVRDPSSTSALRVLGACQWRFYDENPFPKGPQPITANWWPEGLQRDFASEFTRQNLHPRVQWMQRPHSGLSWLGTRPECRRQGVGRALMQWGIERTDAMGLESFIEASADGRPLYELMGYRFVARCDTDTSGMGHSKEWQRIEQTYLPFGYDAVWRPAHGKWEAGEPERTWTPRLQLPN